MELHLKIIGSILIVLAFIHVAFPRYFKWKAELSGLLLINRQMMYVHTFFIALAVLLVGLLCLTSSRELVETKLGGKIALGMFIFWLLRLWVQWFGYSRKLWKGRIFETIIHIVFSFLWIYLSIVFFLVYRANML